MVATVIILRKTGSGPTTSNITSINTRANTTDIHSTADTTAPIQIPTDTSTKRSFWVVTRLQCTVAPASLIDNIEWYTDGANSFGTGVACIGQQGTSYTQATGTTGDTGLALTTGNDLFVATDPVNVFTFTSAAPRTITGSTSGTGEFGNSFVYQITVTSDASPGATTQETWTWRFDET